MSRLLVATDLSPRSDRAVERAVHMARQRSLPLTVLHVIDEDIPARHAARLQEVAVEEIGNVLQKHGAREDADVSVRIEFGKAYADILRVAASESAEAIVMGVVGPVAFPELFRGTTVERVVRYGQCPVYVVRDHFRSPYARLVVAIDFSACARRALEYAVTAHSGAEIHLVHAFDVPFRGFMRGRGLTEEVTVRHVRQLTSVIDEDMAAFLAALDVRIPADRRIVEEGTVHTVVTGHVERLRADLLVVGTHGRTGIPHAILGSTAESLIREPPCDMLVVKV